MELIDERESLVLGQMITDLKSGNTRAAKVTGVMLLREFLMLRIAPLQARAPPEGTGDASPSSKADTLCSMPDDAEIDVCQEEGEMSTVSTRGRSSLVSRNAAPALTPPRTASSSSTAPLSGFKLPKWKVEYFAVDR